MIDRNDFAPVLISTGEIESLERIASHLHSELGMVMEWASLLTLIEAAKRAHAEAEKHNATVDAVRCAFSA